MLSSQLIEEGIYLSFFCGPTARIRVETYHVTKVTSLLALTNRVVDALLLLLLLPCGMTSDSKRPVGVQHTARGCVSLCTVICWRNDDATVR